MKCWKKNCKNEVEFTCWCRFPTIHLCSQHIAEHLQIESETEHTLISQTILPNPETKKALIGHIHKSLTNLYKFRRKAISEISVKIKLLNKKLEIILNSFKEIIQKHRKMISQISSLKVISKWNNNEIHKILALSPAESVTKLKEDFDIFDESKFFIDDTGKIDKKRSKSENKSNYSHQR